ncbi:HEAT repeat domain-containing protein [Flavobacterium pectinovorum]|uniref:HEAT repeat domain-containing protein n=1 Tax=Flavobacterium pectinovorum TaxID=29533 RepID=UPI00265F4C15|nr:HEAT repeat domain-containing protein [Flavobacterium pectinovorum]WKL48074.1 HEAT repeat domain-containing protein [Flavobacterium pectinovorum]
MDNYLINLIDRMLDTSDQNKEAGYDSSKTISWKALREAENVENTAYIPQLITFIDNEKDKKKRDRSYFLLGHIAKNTSDLKALDYLIYRIQKETDKYIIASLLDRIAAIKKPIGTDLQPLIQATKSDKWLIRHSAIQSLKNALDSAAETALIEILNDSDDPYDLVYTNATINTIGTLRAIPFLEKHLKSRKRDVKDSAKYAIEEIKKRHE